MTPHEGEAHHEGVASKLNWLRAGVLGANDGIVSVAGIVVGVAGASSQRSDIAVAGVAGLVAGALSMAAGEYVSVSTQRDTEKALIAKETAELRDMPQEELEELTQIYQAKGLDRDLAEQVAHQLTEHDALAAHADAELNIDPNELTNPWEAAFASFLAFTVGAALPLAAILLPGPTWRVPITFIAVLIALVITGSVSARLGDAPVRPAVLRNVIGGALAMAITYGIGHAIGLAI
ncbi:VIT1/CCC1 family predicted Fe2+/Mn2+ transporter [Branchiibius hedensis]|uniref:Predicted Fe2+/Mn2+ transporter, VIT1/CCC1 family n=1 Tax=Branchiibius hedensis TaxID=672460 RepID=A0A2Y8ZS10_9MICO|nr:VIT1/CCC1 family predicted Fe2+/Mn2+ transporter [Branchiibius hedensis]SSA33099.1 Predicted Fe2+/Mn2+ transporter, VIT1/CCC1 family [Branchiibius hedensis]